MDELAFHLNRRWQILQIWLSEASQVSARVLEEVEQKFMELVSHSQHLVRMNQTIDEIGSAIKSIGIEVKQRIVLVTNPEYVFSYLSNAVGLDFNRATLYAICFGFTIGSSLGLVLGICLQSPKPPSIYMRSVAAMSYSGPDAITLLEDTVCPHLYKSNQVLVLVKFATLDSLDVKIAKGYGFKLRNILSKYNHLNIMQSGFPIILGREGAGIVVEIGPDVAHVEVGSRVFFTVDPFSQGCLSEYALVDSRDICPIPDTLSFDAAASFPKSAVEAWTAVSNIAKLTSKNAHSKSILVHCIGAGSSWLILQLCSALGAQNLSCTVPSSQSTTANTTAARAFGARDVILLDNCAESELNGRKFDVIFNTVGPQAKEFCCSLTERGGHVVNAYDPQLASDSFGWFLSFMYSTWVRLNYELFRRETWRSSLFPYSRPALENVTRLLRRQMIRPVRYRTFNPELIDSAIASAEMAMGRVLINMQSARKNGWFPHKR